MLFPRISKQNDNFFLVTVGIMMQFVDICKYVIFFLTTKLSKRICQAFGSDQSDGLGFTGFQLR